MLEQPKPLKDTLDLCIKRNHPPLTRCKNFNKIKLSPLLQVNKSMQNQKLIKNYY